MAIPAFSARKAGRIRQAPITPARSAMAKTRMLRFVSVGQAGPDKRAAPERRADFDEIYAGYAAARRPNRQAAAASAASPSVRFIARSGTTSPTG